jgi:hypothetical protein
MKRMHVALAVRDYAAAVREYTERLGAKPCCTVEGTYALWRTVHVNLSVRVRPEQAGTVRHLGLEDSDAVVFGAETDANGFVWERFTAEQQDEEIRAMWPHATFA